MLGKFPFVTREYTWVRTSESVNTLFYIANHKNWAIYRKSVENFIFAKHGLEVASNFQIMRKRPRLRFVRDMEEASIGAIAFRL